MSTLRTPGRRFAPRYRFNITCEYPGCTFTADPAHRLLALARANEHVVATGHRVILATTRSQVTEEEIEPAPGEKCPCCKVYGCEAMEGAK